MAQMRAFRIHRFGGPDVLRSERIDVPPIGPNEVLVRVKAASVNPVDIKTRDGKYPVIGEDKLPFTLGRDFAGTLERVGQSLSGWEHGAEVFGFVGQGQGALAEFVVIVASGLAPRPASMDSTAAAAVPLAALTAWQGLFDQGGLQKGQRVLIHAGAGGVGHLAVQFARHVGAEVFATATGDGVEFVESLEADHVIDYKKQPFEEVARDMDLVFDLIGGETQSRSWQTVKRDGTMISTLTEPSATEAARHGAHAARYTARPDGAQLAEIGRLIDAGEVKVNVIATYPFASAADALARLEKGHVHGKIVVNAFDA
ncbi:NADPH:quinone reductase [Paraburkholderia fungorum]|uniref:NADPH:quinone reductase n=1 Tax=Paraburkholderia fungorum TaxID=134537 RepID=A0A1H1JN63_9BURK|nr:NADP-dependent oxidoreductase [Paraburkholderia fungorum]SDR51458.1 NADPH:quinone reductase [Paraburkholderia fungorum]